MAKVQPPSSSSVTMNGLSHAPLIVSPVGTRPRESAPRLAQRWSALSRSGNASSGRSRSARNVERCVAAPTTIHTKRDRAMCSPRAQAMTIAGRTTAPSLVLGHRCALAGPTRPRCRAPAARAGPCRTASKASRSEKGGHLGAGRGGCPRTFVSIWNFDVRPCLDISGFDGGPRHALHGIVSGVASGRAGCSLSLDSHQ